MWSRKRFLTFSERCLNCQCKIWEEKNFNPLYGNIIFMEIKSLPHCGNIKADENSWRHASAHIQMQWFTIGNVNLLFCTGKKSLRLALEYFRLIDIQFLIIFCQKTTFFFSFSDGRDLSNVSMELKCR